MDNKFLSVSFHIPVELPGRDLVEKFFVLTCVALDFLWALGIVGPLFDKKKWKLSNRAIMEIYPRLQEPSAANISERPR